MNNNNFEFNNGEETSPFGVLLILAILIISLGFLIDVII
jgi:hypothetical protein